MAKRISTPKIVLIGAGNVGTHLGKEFFRQGIPVIQVFSRRKKRAQALANQIGATTTNDLSKITPEGDIYIIAVHDSAIEMVAKQLTYLDDGKRLFAHTSGATPSTVFKGILKNYGVFYPLQTFSEKRKADFSNIPICIDAKKKKAFKILIRLANQLSPKVYSINDQQRAVLHVAAVFVNNFSNHLFHIGNEICEKGEVPFEVLLPLIQETAAKIQEHPPKMMQTGPAIRGDKSTIERHLDFLQDHPSFQTIYQLMTESIWDIYQESNRSQNRR